MTARAFITGLAGTALTPAERAFLRESAPWGLILFKRNIETPAQVTPPGGRHFARRWGAMRRCWSIRRAAACSASARRTGRPIRRARPMAGSTTAIAAAGLSGGPPRRPADRRRSLARRHRRRLPAARRRAGRRRRRGDRRPRLWRHARARSRRIAARGRRGPAGRAACCRCSSTFPATAAPPPTAIGELPVVDTDRATLEATDFAAFRPLSDLPLGMTAHVVFTRHRSCRSGHDFGHNGP